MNGILDKTAEVVNICRIIALRKYSSIYYHHVLKRIIHVLIMSLTYPVKDRCLFYFLVLYSPIDDWPNHRMDL